MNINRTIVVDCGKNSAAYYDPISKNNKIISHKDLLNLHENLNLGKGDYIVGEYAHLGCPRSNFSLSQPYTKKDLTKYYKSLDHAGVKLKLFPEQSTPRAYYRSGLTKSDLNDCKSIYLLLKDHPEISLMNPPCDFEENEFMMEMWSWKDLTNKILNTARSDKYDLAGKGTDLNTLWIIDNLPEINSQLSENARECFHLNFYAKKPNELKIKTKGDWSFSMTQFYSILATMRYHCYVEDKVKYRLRNSTKNFLSNKDFKRYIICMSPFHRKGGVARSNLYHHGIKNWIISKGKAAGLNFNGKSRGQFTKQEDDFFKTHRTIYSKSCMEVFSIMKDMFQKELDLPRHKKN